MSRRRGELDRMMEQFENLRSDYSAAKQGRFRRRRSGLSLSGSGADYHIRSEADYLRILEYARDIDRNDIIVGQGINRLVDNVLQDGIRLDPQTGDEALNLELWQRWEDWTTDPDACHIAGELDFLTILRLILRHAVVDGDIVALPLEAGSLQLVEAHRLRTPRGTTRNVVHGILLDENRRRLEYWLTKDDIDPWRPISKVSDIRRYPARDADGNKQVLHLYFPRRATQTRGVSALAPVIDATGMHDDIQFAKLVQQQVVSCFTIFRERPEDYAGGSATGYGAKETQLLSDGSRRQIEGLGPGLELSGDPGEKLHGFSPAVPNPEFFEHAMMVLTFVAVNLDLPVQVLLLDPRATNFSGWRGAMDQARLGLREKQRWLANGVCRPLYLWKLRQWAVEDPALSRMLGKNPNSKRHRWNPATWPYIEPLKDAQADSHRLEKRLTSPRRLQMERGRDWEEVAAEIVEDNVLAVVMAKEAAKQVNEQIKDDDPVSWRELLSMAPKPQVMAPPAEGPPDEETDDEGRPKEDQAAKNGNGRLHLEPANV